VWAKSSGFGLRVRRTNRFGSYCPLGCARVKSVKSLSMFRRLHLEDRRVTKAVNLHQTTRRHITTYETKCSLTSFLVLFLCFFLNTSFLVVHSRECTVSINGLEGLRKSTQCLIQDIQCLNRDQNQASSKTNPEHYRCASPLGSTLRGRGQHQDSLALTSICSRAKIVQSV
jgi:hypothetical protein